MQAPNAAAPANPLLDFTGLPRFAAIRPEHIAPAVDTLLEQNRALVARLTAPGAAADWESFVTPLEEANERLGRAWGVVGHLHSVLDSPELREAYTANQPKVVQYWTELGQNLALFDRYKALRAGPGFMSLAPAQRRILDNEIRDFRLSGAELPEAQKKRFAEIQERLAAICTQFSENVLDATNAFSLVIGDRAELEGIPEDVLEAARAAAEKDGNPGWKFTLQAPSYLPVMQYAANRALREKVYRAYATRASEFGPAERDNGPIVAEILRLRRESARLLGHATYAELSLVPKMADTPEQVMTFLRDLAQRARPHALRDWQELQAFAAAELGLEKLEAWDVAWASEKLRERRYAFSDQEVKQYFPEPKVLEGLFRLIGTLYGVKIEEDRAEVWDPAVRFFRIVDAAGGLVGKFYLDLYARETKRGGAWMDETIARRRRSAASGDGVQAPVAYLVCNFSAPVGGKPAVFTHDEVLTLFHEFGHGLHHLLTRVDHLGVSGIRGVEWDAVELPSQFMENYCWEWEVLSHMTAHVDSGEPLPRSLFDKMIAAKNFQAGMAMVRQVEFSLFDMELHHGFDPDGKRSPLDLLAEVRREVAVVIPPDWHRLPHSFSHLFAGSGYAAGYYSYKWAEVLSADAYAAFEEARDSGESSGVLDPAVGARFRDEILAVGGSRDAIESFRAFRGRDPSVDALLRHNGMVDTIEAAATA